MRKHIVLSALLIFSFLLVFSCLNFALPSKIKVTASPTINLPMGGYEESLSERLFTEIKNAMGSGDDNTDGIQVKKYEKPGDTKKSLIHPHLHGTGEKRRAQDDQKNRRDKVRSRQLAGSTFCLVLPFSLICHAYASFRIIWERLAP